MEEPADSTARPGVDQDSCRCADDVIHREQETTATTTLPSDAGRRYSDADCTDLRRRYTTTNYAAGTQFKGLVIPSPAAGGSDTTKPSTCFLPTITGTKPQSKLPLTSSTQRRGSSAYQSVLTGQPFISTPISNAGKSASNVQRRSSVHVYPFLQHTSTSSYSRSLIQASGTSQCENNVSVGSDGDASDAGNADMTQHADNLGMAKSKTTLVSTDSTGASDEILTHVPSIPAHHREDGKLLSGVIISSSSTVVQHEVDRDSSMTKSLRVNSLKVGKQHEEHTENVVDIEKVTSDGVDVGSCALPTSISKLPAPECHPESLDPSVVPTITALQLQSNTADDGDVRSDWRETSSSTAGRDEAASTAVIDADSGIWQPSIKSSPARQGSQVDGESNGDAVTKSIARPDNDNLTNIVINKGNLGLGFCIAGGRGSMTGDDRIVVKRIFKGIFKTLSPIYTPIDTGSTAAGRRVNPIIFFTDCNIKSD